MAEGTESYQGMALPLVGEAKMTGNTAANDVFTIEGASSQSGDLLVLQTSTPTEVFYVESDGVTNHVITNPGADNCVDLTITDASTMSSGYLQGYYVSLTTSGSYTSAAQINAIAIDMFLGGTPNVEAAGLYIYLAPSSSPASPGNIACATMYLMDMGAAPSYQAVLNLYKNTTNSGSTSDAFIFMVNQGSGTTNTLFGVGGTNHPSYFLKTMSADGSGKMVRTESLNGSITKALAVCINGSTMRIPLYAATT